MGSTLRVSLERRRGAGWFHEKKSGPLHERAVEVAQRYAGTNSEHDPGLELEPFFDSASFGSSCVLWSSPGKRRIHHSKTMSFSV